MKKRRLISLTLLLGVLAAILVGCAPDSDEEPAAIEAPSRAEDEASGSMPSSAVQTTDVPQELNVTPTRTALELEQAVEQSEESDMMDNETDNDQNEAVTPAVVDLRRITPEPPLEKATPRVIPGPGIPNPSAAASNRAAVNLAGELELDVENVEVLSVEAVEWSDSSLGCPKPGQNYMSVITPGFRVILMANGQQYEYHTNQDGTMLAQCQGGGSPAGTLDR